jgi:spoIIIJ-associated protein
MLEPMNPYERRIIHAELQSFAGVNTNSIGSESNRKVVIYLDENKK